MNREEIIRKMQEAGLKAPARGDFIFIHWDQIAMLLDHERAAEREACAKVCDELADAYQKKNPTSSSEPLMRSCWNNAAAAIRARGQP